MAKAFYSELNFLLKISTLFLILGLGFTYPKFSETDGQKTHILIEKANVAINLDQAVTNIKPLN